MNERVTTPSGETVVTEAPEDGEYYGRVDGRWDLVTEEAPIDGKTYARYEGNWVEATGTPVDFGIGLSQGPGADPGDPEIVHLTPAGDSPATLGGVYVVDRVRNVEEGLELGIDGRLRAPLATDSLAGTLLEPPPDDRGYVRARSAAGVSAWVPPADTPGYDYGTGLSVDRTPVPPDQPIVNLTPAGPLPQHLGGVYVPPRDDTLKSGLTIDMGDEALGDPATGELLAPPASDLLLGTLTEPPPDGMAYSRQWDNITDPANPKWVWVPALTAGLQITSIIPDKTIYGPGKPLLDVHAYGAEFTGTCVIHVDGNPAQTSYVSPTELIFVMNPAVPVSEQFHIITVHETAPVPADGLGAEQFDFIKSSAEVDYGLGLSLDTNYTPPVVDLQPAGWDNPKFLGGIYGTARSATNGLDIDAMGTGYTTVPLATDLLAGSIVEPPPDSEKYVRTRNEFTGISSWEKSAAYIDFEIGLHEWRDPNTGERLNRVDLKPATVTEIGGLLEVPQLPDDGKWVRTWRGWEPLPPAAETDYGIGLSLNPGADPGDPPIVHLQPAGNQEKFLGGVYVTPVRGRGQGLDLDADGRLTLPPATSEHLGGLLEPQETNTSYARMVDPVTRIGQWVELPPDSGIGDVPPNPPIVWGRTTGRWVELPEQNQGITDVPPDPPIVWGRATGRWMEIPYPAPGIEDVPADPTGQQYSRQHGNWHPIPPPSLPERPAGKIEAEIGVVYVPDRLGLYVMADGAIGLQPATKDAIGGLREVPGDGPWLRKTGVWEQYVPPVIPPQDPGMEEPPANPVAIWGRSSAGARGWLEIVGPGGLPLDPLLYVHVNGDTMQGSLMLAHEGALAMEAVTVSQLERQKVEAGIGLSQIGPRIDLQPATNIQIGGILDAPDDGQQYARKFREWERVAPSATPVTYGVGIDEEGGVVNLKQANFNGEIGGVLVVGRGPTQGLEYDAPTGTLWAPLATDIAAGAIVEPPPDGSQYCRTRDMGGLSTWVRSAAGGVIVADDPPDEAMTPAGTLWWESDTGELYILYDDGTSKQWVEAVATPNAGVQTHIGDLPPAIANVGDLWWDSDAGTLAIYYQDVDSTQWVQIAGPMPEPPAGGIAEAPIDGTPYSRQDAGWVASAAALAMFTPGDLKHGFQVADHAGWIKLDGRAVSTLTATQQAAAATLGFTTNLPLGDGAVFMQSAAVLGSVSGGTLTQAMLPNVTLTSSNSAALTSGNSAALNTGDAGAHDVVSPYSSHEMTINTASSIFSIDEGVMVTIPAHNHTIPAHNHSIPAHNHPVPLGGTGADIVPKNISANAFVYLGV